MTGSEEHIFIIFQPCCTTKNYEPVARGVCDTHIYPYFKLCTILGSLVNRLMFLYFLTKLIISKLPYRKCNYVI